MMNGAKLFGDLDPRWIHPNILAFRCPCCRKLWLTIKDREISREEQRVVFQRAFGTEADEAILTPPSVTWNINSREFELLSVFPPVDASRGGHWYGSVVKGVVVTFKFPPISQQLARLTQ